MPRHLAHRGVPRGQSLRRALAATVIGLLDLVPQTTQVAPRALCTFSRSSHAAEFRGEIPLAALHPNGLKTLVRGAKALNLRLGYKAGLRCPRADVLPLPT